MCTVGDLWFRAGTGYWYVTVGKKQVRLAKGKESWDKADAERSRIVLMENAKIKGGPEKNAEETVETLFALYLKNMMPSFPAKTQKRKHQYYDRFLGKFGDKALSSLSPLDITIWLREEKTWADNTKLAAIKQLSAVFKWLILNNIITHNPMAAVKRPQEVIRSAEVAIDQATYERLRDNAPPYMAWIIRGLWETGARPEELLSARADEWLADGGCINKLLANKNGKKGQFRYIVVPDNLHSEIAARIAKNPTCFLFPLKKGSEMGSQDFQQRLKVIAERLGYPEGKIIAYGFRHGFAVRMLAMGMLPADVAALMGHSSTKQLERYYAHTDALVAKRANAYRAKMKALGTQQS